MSGREKAALILDGAAMALMLLFAASFGARWVILAFAVMAISAARDLRKQK